MGPSSGSGSNRSAGAFNSRNPFTDNSGPVVRRPGWAIPQRGMLGAKFLPASQEAQKKMEMQKEAQNKMEMTMNKAVELAKRLKK